MKSVHDREPPVKGLKLYDNTCNITFELYRSLGIRSPNIIRAAVFGLNFV
jgi:predicted secreted Zn-dependent protease